jgi:hypothetical protein
MHTCPKQVIHKLTELLRTFEQFVRLVGRSLAGSAKLTTAFASASQLQDERGFCRKEGGGHGEQAVLQIRARVTRSGWC